MTRISYDFKQKEKDNIKNKHIVVMKIIKPDSFNKNIKDLNNSYNYQNIRTEASTNEINNIFYLNFNENNYNSLFNERSVFPGVSKTIKRNGTNYSQKRNNVYYNIESPVTTQNSNQFQKVIKITHVNNN